MSKTELGVNQVAQRIHLRLRRYLEAQYHVRETGIINERLAVLNEPGGISQRPFVEITPSYAVQESFSKLKITATVRDLLTELSRWRPSINVFPPYQHQADALENFFGAEAKDLIVATGTGSGKTETFLYAVLGMLAVEAAERSASFTKPGVRALLLYPMNALVSDQTARLRRLFGDERLAALFRERWRRHPRFGMYTSRTPYPGVRAGAKDSRHLSKLVSYYEVLETSANAEDQTLVRELRQRGRWPAKDMVKFFARHREEQTTFKTGKKAGQPRALHHWLERFHTDRQDRELLTRHEMHEGAPDLLVTNYSMLEYMLLRPIERPLFAQTRDWLAADIRNQLLLVLDEAHMYRGVGGAEVGLLIRRLISRLGIGRERLRCILTSASLGTGADAERAGEAFARSLTGDSATRKFAVVRGTREARPVPTAGTKGEALALAQLHGEDLGAARVAPDAAYAELVKVCDHLKWSPPPPIEAEEGLAARQYVARQLTGFGPLELLIKLAAGNAIPFAELSRALFPSVSLEDAERATNGLLALGSFSRRFEPGREEQPLTPTRVHLLFRGLPSLYVCINPRCPSRRHRPNEDGLVGRIFTAPCTHCACGGRVFELLTHRDCGTAYLRGYGVGARADFLWHERGGTLTEFGKPLHALHLLLEEPHPKALGDVDPVLLDIASGRLLAPSGTEIAGTRLCYRPVAPADGEDNLSTFATCPCCLRATRTGNSLKIMDLATKGEQPFANLVREQFVSQVATRPASERYPNEGRKALLFSDGRQKAARLARDLPREVERDSFREALVLATDALRKLRTPRESVLDDQRMYAAFVATCAKFHLHFFDGPDQKALLEECIRFRTDYGDLETALDSDWRPTVPTRYRQVLLRQIGDPYYSIVAACAAVVEPRASKLQLVQRRVGSGMSADMVRDVADAWVRVMLGKGAFDPALNKDSRQDEFPYFEPIRSDEGLKRFFEDLRSRANLDSSLMALLRRELFDVFTREAAGGDSGRLLLPDCLVLRLTLEETWNQCVACGHLQLRPFCGVCVNCGERRLESRPPSHEYIATRKGFFREPLIAVLRGERPVHITAEEHTAQLSQRDAGVVYATTEEFELRFQDVPLGPSKPPVDILSCTTTMEVGIDIGSLTAVGLRTVPPQRENYQQRAGRAGRRGSSVSSVLTFAQGGPHDAYYFENPGTMISGAPREPRVKTDNRRLAKRHIHSHLLQTFFHGQIDRLPPAEQRSLARKRPGIMSAYGTAREFFTQDGPFSFRSLDSWVVKAVLVPKSAVLEEIASWLPPEISTATDTLDDRQRFAREITEQLRSALSNLRAEFASSAKGAAKPEDVGHGDEDEDEDDDGHDDEDAISVLDLLFDRGLLPSYAFPTGLSSFVIQEFDDKRQVQIKERPQLAKSQALSEYAPGRLLVVNKRTYRVGGIFIDGPPTSAPAAAVLGSTLRRYVGCKRCTFVQIAEGAADRPTAEGTPCPVCREPLVDRPFLDPPAFAPEGGQPLAEGDRDQDITFASSAQLPELVDQKQFEWQKAIGSNLKHAYGVDVLLVVANKGKEAAGFSVCDQCGGAWLDGDEPQGAHARPFLLPSYILQREQASRQCQGGVRREIFLGHEFRTDVLLLRIPFKAPFDFSPKQPWLYDALATLSEAVSLAASLELDIDPGDLSAGFRLLPRLDEDEQGVGELFLFDTASGGAGYAADAGENLAAILDRTAALLRDCPANCERSCTQCLRHYGNRFLHTRLDRHLALAVLKYARTGQLPAIASTARQTEILMPLARFLELEGWSVTRRADDVTPLLAVDGSGKRVAVGVFPALLMTEEAHRVHPLPGLPGRSDLRVVLLPDQVVERDLPSARRTLAAEVRSNPHGGSPQPKNAELGRSELIELRAVDLRSLLTAAPIQTGTVKLASPQLEPGCFAVRAPSGALARTGITAGSWLVLRPLKESDADGQQLVLALRSRGNFRATSAWWTIAKVRRLDDPDARLQLSYGRKETEFRPERVTAEEVTLAAAVLHSCQAEG